MKKDLTVFYRAYGGETDGDKIRDDRPHWFDKKKCFKSFYQEFGPTYPNGDDVSIKVLWDGPETSLADFIKQHKVDFIKLNYRNNQQSLAACYAMAKKEKNDKLYFCEDDYLHLPGSKHAILEGIEKRGLFTLYHHPDRLIARDDITRGQEEISALNFGYIRTGESTTQTFAINKTVFDRFYDDFLFFCNKGSGAPDDRGLFRNFITKYGIRLWHPVNSLSTHCVRPCLAFYVNWQKFNEEIEV